jgi:hypothetical protein
VILLDPYPHRPTLRQLVYDFRNIPVRSLDPPSVVGTALASWVVRATDGFFSRLVVAGAVDDVPGIREIPATPVISQLILGSSTVLRTPP